MNLKQTQTLWKKTMNIIYDIWKSSFCPKPKDRMVGIIEYLQNTLYPFDAEYDIKRTSTTNPNDFVVDEDISKYQISYKFPYETPKGDIKYIKFFLYITIYLGEKVNPEINYYSDYLLEAN
jgi:hypothetical protein